MSKAAKDAKERRTRRHTPRQLHRRPVTFDTCAGPLTITAEPDGKQFVVRIEHPPETAVVQEGSANDV